jgi:crotonobetainyl-CoA:carnitine CoA-transferase CaiB-like acyl-CoA transferase
LTDARQRPLTGMRVVDLSTSYAGPTATMYLAEMGADVLKIERREGDDTRSWGPPFVDGESAWFISANRNKRSVCLDLTQPEGRDHLFTLLAGADVLVESFNPAKLVKLGIHPDDLRARFPRLIYCALSGFGLDGPDADLPGYDLIAQARSGLMSVTGAAGGSPQRVSTALSDVVAALIAAFAVAAAFRHQERTGEGEVIDVTLLEADLALLAPRVASYLAGDAEPRPSGATDSVLFPYQPFPTADRPIVVAAGNDRIWRRFIAAIDLPELLADEFATNAGRKGRRDFLVAAISERLASEPSAHWLGAFRAAGVPAAPVQSLSEMLLDPQVVARRMVTSVEHPTGGPGAAVLEAPWVLGSRPRPVAHRRPPALGEHAAEVRRLPTGKVAAEGAST